MRTNKKLIHKTALNILAYLEQNPEAMDTEDGIANWWITGETRLLRSGLNLLIEKKIIKSRELQGGKLLLSCGTVPEPQSNQRVNLIWIGEPGQKPFNQIKPISC